MLTFKKSNEQLKKGNNNKKIRIGVSFNGRQCPGGHNAILGLLDENT